MEKQSQQVNMKTPSGKIVPFEKWIRTCSTRTLVNDIKKMLILTNKEAQRLASLKVRGKDGKLATNPDARMALEMTYYMLLMLIADTTKPLPVENEVE